MKKIFTALVALVAVVTLTACGSDNSGAKVTKIRAEKSSLEITAPFSLMSAPLDEFDGMETYIKKSEVKAADENGIILAVTSVVFDKQKISAETGEEFVPDLEGALKGAVENMEHVKNSGGVTDVEINGIHAKEITGSAEVEFSGASNPSPCEFRAVSFADDGEFWMVFMARKPDDKTKAVADEIFNSLKLTK